MYLVTNSLLPIGQESSNRFMGEPRSKPGLEKEDDLSETRLVGYISAAYPCPRCGR